MAAIIATNVNPAQVLRPANAQMQPPKAIDVAIGSHAPKGALLDEIHGKAGRKRTSHPRFATGASHDLMDAVDGGVPRGLAQALLRSLPTGNVREFGSLNRAAQKAGIAA